MPEANASDFPSRYDPRPVEGKWYRFWEESGFFTANAQSERPKFSIVIPPPNITGSLHVGHALNNSLQDAQTGGIPEARLGVEGEVRDAHH
jgi:valyl-tRNA synthetase